MSDDLGREPPAMEAATACFARLRGGLPQQPGEDGWNADEPACQEAYAEVAVLWDQVGALRSDPSILAMREDARAQLSRWRLPRINHVRTAALVMILTMTALLAGYVARSWRAADEGTASVRQFSTRIGQIASVALPDGSLAILDTASTIRFHDRARGERRIELVIGRALFRVAKIANRPFVVDAGGTMLTALGTKFDAFRTESGVAVNLIEGRLGVTRHHMGGAVDPGGEPQLVMAAGDRLSVTGHRWLLARGGADEQVGWTHGQLVFDDVALGDVVAMLNRYTLRKIEIADDGLARQRISAVIRTGDPLMLAEALQTMGISDVVQRDGGVALVSPKKVVGDR